MREVPFTIFNTSQSASVIAERIAGSHDHLFRYLHIPVQFAFNRPKADATFDVPVIVARLSSVSPVQFIGEEWVSSAISVLGPELNWGRGIRFKLTDEILQIIEAKRLQTNVKYSVKELTGKRSFVSDYLQNETVTLSLEIPQSVWIEKILAPSGFRNLKLIELPLSHDALKEAYADIVFEFGQAEKYFNIQDYDKAVGHCRGTLDALTRNLKKIREQLDTEKGFDWLKNVDQETLTWIDKLNQRTSRITSAPHHAGHRVGFSRAEAESIYIVTLGLLHYVGHIAT